MVALFRSMNPVASPAGPRADRIDSGEPQATVRRLHESPDGRFSAGTWTCTPGRWHVAYDEIEYCRITAGTGFLIELGGETLALATGDEFVVPAGFRGMWEVTETITKTWVVVLP